MMAAVLARLAPFDLPCPVVDDGSEESTRHTGALSGAASAGYAAASGENSGKGAAVMAGLKACAERGFTHAIRGCRRPARH